MSANIHDSKSPARTADERRATSQHNSPTPGAIAVVVLAVVLGFGAFAKAYTMYNEANEPEVPELTAEEEFALWFAEEFPAPMDPVQERAMMMQRAAMDAAYGGSGYYDGYGY